MLHLHPELVHLDRVMDLPAAALPRYDRLPVRPELTPRLGLPPSAASASEEAERLLLDRTSAALAAALGPSSGVPCPDQCPDRRHETSAQNSAQTPPTPPLDPRPLQRRTS